MNRSIVSSSSILLRLDYIFAATFCVYFFLFPLLSFLDLIGNSLIDQLYASKGLEFFSRDALFYCLTGLVFFVLGYRLVANPSRFIKKCSFFSTYWSYRNILIFAVFVFAAGVGSKIIGVFKNAHEHPHYASQFIESQLLNFFIILNPLQILAITLIFFGFVRARAEGDLFWKKIFAYAFFPIYFVLVSATLTQGSKAVTLGLLFPILAIYGLTLSSKKSFAVVCILGLTTLAVMGGKTFVERQNIGGSVDIVRTGVVSFIGRVNQSHIVTRVIAYDETPIGPTVLLEWYEHLKPKQYRNSIIQNGNEFARQYGFVNDRDLATGVGRTVIGGLHLAFGFNGVIIGMFLLGVLYSFISGFATTPTGIIFFGISLLNLLLRIEQDVVFLVIMVFFHLSIVLVAHIFMMDDGLINKLERKIGKIRDS